MDTAVRMTSIGLAFFGALLMKSITPSGSSRSARSVLLNLSSFLPVRQPVVPEKVDDFLEAHLAGELVDVVAASRSKLAFARHHSR